MLVALLATHVLAQSARAEIRGVADERSRPAAGAIWEIPVLSIRLLPSLDGVNLDPAAGTSMALEDMQRRLDRMESNVKYSIEEGSRYHGYQNADARPSLGVR